LSDIKDDPSYEYAKKGVQVTKQDNTKNENAAPESSTTEQKDAMPMSSSPTPPPKSPNRDDSSNFGLHDLPTDLISFMAWVKLHHPLDFLNCRTKSLAQHLNQWRESRGKGVVKNPDCYVSMWKTLIRERARGAMNASFEVKRKETSSNEPKTIQLDDIQILYEEDSDEDNDVFDDKAMFVVSSLSKRYINEKTGLPVYEFTVHPRTSIGKCKNPSTDGPTSFAILIFSLLPSLELFVDIWRFLPRCLVFISSGHWPIVD
jgi:hypothetical protein